MLMLVYVLTPMYTGYVFKIVSILVRCHTMIPRWGIGIASFSVNYCAFFDAHVLCYQAW